MDTTWRLNNNKSINCGGLWSSAKAMSVGMPQTYQVTIMGYFLTIEEHLCLISERPKLDKSYVLLLLGLAHSLQTISYFSEISRYFASSLNNCYLLESLRVVKRYLPNFISDSLDYKERILPKAIEKIKSHGEYI